MEDPAPLMEQQMAESTEVLALRASIKEGKRLLRQAIKERDIARSEAARRLETHWALISTCRAIGDHWLFRFFPAWLRESLHNQVGLGNHRDYIQTGGKVLGQAEKKS